MSFEDLNIEFNTSTMQYEVGPPEWLKKASIIADISTMRESLGKGGVTHALWDILIEKTIGQLTEIVEGLAQELREKNHQSSSPLNPDLDAE